MHGDAQMVSLTPGANQMKDNGWVAGLMSTFWTGRTVREPRVWACGGARGRGGNQTWGGGQPGTPVSRRPAVMTVTICQGVACPAALDGSASRSRPTKS